MPRCTCQCKHFFLNFFPKNETLVGWDEKDKSEIKFPKIQSHGFWKGICGIIISILSYTELWLVLPIVIIPIVYSTFHNFLSFDLTSLHKDDTADFQQVLQSLSATFGILISLMFTNALTRYKS